jgi:hypothetical protein
MIRRHSLALRGVIVVASVMNGVAEENGNVSISIQCPQSEVKSGSEVKLLVTVTNASGGNLNAHMFENGHAGDAVKIEVGDESGKLLPRIGSPAGGGRAELR